MLRLGSSIRLETPAATLTAAQRLMAPCGISRVTDITRMDRLGLPVFASIRPRGAVLRVHAGKGILPIEARVGALMEAVEFAVAEGPRDCSALQSCSIGALVDRFEGFRLIDLAPRYGVRISDDRRIPTVDCEDIARSRTVPLPAELVFVPFTLDPADMLFGWTSNGLASGNSIDEATVHGLLEVMERDAIAIDRVECQSQWVMQDTLPSPFAELADQWRRIGIDLAVRFVPNDCALPCFEAMLHEATSDDVNLARGSGLHVDRDIALARAICEAAQSRLSGIHGGREDLTTFFSKYSEDEAGVRQSAEQALLARFFDRQRSVDYRELPQPANDGASITEVLQSLLRLLAACGFDRVLRHCFDADLGGLHVVKVIVPSCESIMQASGRIGPRLLTRIAAHA